MAGVPAALLREELRPREQRASALVRRYERLMQRAWKLRAEIEAAGGAIQGLSSARKRNETSLIDALATALAGQTLSVDEAAQAVLATGYRSTSSDSGKSSTSRSPAAAGSNASSEGGTPRNSRTGPFPEPHYRPAAIGAELVAG